MRLPSLSLIASQVGKITRRFPLVVLCAAVAIAGAVGDRMGSSATTAFLRLYLAGLLGLPVFVALHLAAERVSRGRIRLAPFVGLAVAGLVAFYVAWPHWNEPLAWRRYVQASLALHLLAAFLPYVRRTELTGFWQYNRVLFLRFLTSALFGAVLYAGLGLALAAVDTLFGVDIDAEVYLDLFHVIAYGFVTLYFLGGIPRQLGELDSVEDYPKGIRVFAQYILLPLVALYLTILTAYLAKVLITRVWPQGWIGYLVSSVSAVGLLSLLLLYPIERRGENRWVQRYARGFYIAVLPALAMLLAAIGKRISQYAVTENRYYLLVLTIWMAGLCVYFLVSRSRRILVIPASLCLVAATTFFGPWGAYTMSRRSQTNRLENLLVRGGLMENGRVQAATAPVSFEDRKQIADTFRYLLETHGRGPVRAWFGEQWAEIDTFQNRPPEDREVARHQGGLEARELTKQIMATLEIEHVEEWQREPPDFLSHSTSSDYALDISGYDLLLRFQSYTPGEATDEEGRYRFFFDHASNRYVLQQDGEEVVSLSLAEVVEAAREIQKTNSDPATMAPVIFERVSPRLETVLIVRGLMVRLVEEAYELQSSDVEVLIRAN